MFGDDVVTYFGAGTEKVGQSIVKYGSWLRIYINYINTFSIPDAFPFSDLGVDACPGLFAAILKCT